MSVSIALLLYKLAVVLAGTVSIFLGYLLFRHGIFEPAGDLDARFKNTRLVLKQAAPGVFFALFGTAILCFTITKGFSIDQPQMSRGQRNLLAEILIHIDQDETLGDDTRKEYVSILSDLLEDGRSAVRGLASERPQPNPVSELLLE